MVVDFNRTDLPNGICLGDVLKRGQRGRKQFLVVGAYPAHQTAWLVTLDSRFARDCIRTLTDKPIIGPEERPERWMEVRSRAFIPRPKKNLSWRVCMECGHKEKDITEPTDPAESFLEADLTRYVVVDRPLRSVLGTPDLPAIEPQFTASDVVVMRSLGVAIEATCDDSQPCDECGEDIRK